MNVMRAAAQMIIRRPSCARSSAYRNPLNYASITWPRPLRAEKKAIVPAEGLITGGPALIE